MSASIFLALILNVPAVEPWAEGRLPAVPGLAAWYSAEVQGKAHAAMGLAEPKAGANLGRVFDGSGKGRHVAQGLPKQQPKLLRQADSWLIRLDGEDDLLRGTAQGAGTTQQLTLFAVAVPHQSLGSFPGLFAIGASNGRDYETGFNLDLGSQFKEKFEALNIEGKGMGGERNLLTRTWPLGEARRLTALVSDKDATVWVDGLKQGSRPRTGGEIAWQELVLGGRWYTNGPGPQEARGSFPGDIAEVLVYDRALSDGERLQVEQYLAAKHDKLLKADRLALGLPEATAPIKLLDPVVPCQVLVPGFEARWLPVDLPNINNLMYRPDGKLIALGYNGMAWLLEDTDNDGLEDKATVWFENPKGSVRSPIGMDLLPKGHPLGEGLVVACKGKVVLLHDPDNDGKATEKVLAQGWVELPLNVDALGVAVDPKDGSIYFGLGCADFSNGHQVGKDGKAAYQLNSERGTILRLSPDASKREVVCTGIRFPVALRMGPGNELFCSDQEGATWLPNGNPFDELLHIRKGLHFGFPPRHPKHLPSVVDEPSLWDYGPQHQSTCGFNFNLGVNGGPAFGNKLWQGDVLMTGESRGKIYRTTLAKTEAGFVAGSRILACLNVLTVDCCVSPKGDLLVATHSGPPDWGTGPAGKGKLLRLRQIDRDAPQPVAVWASSPREVVVAFDKPLSAEAVEGLLANSRITAGDAVRAGDRFEGMRPGYEVVARQLREPRRSLRVTAARVSPDRRSLLLETDRHDWDTWYSLELPGLGRAGLKNQPAGALPQHGVVDLDYTLNGVMATVSAKGKATWQGWVPHPHAAVTNAMLAGSTHLEQLRAVQDEQVWRFEGKLNLKDMLRPAIQPGATIDHVPPPETVMLRLSADRPYDWKVGNQGRVSKDGANTGTPSIITLKNTEKPIPWSVDFKSAEGAPNVEIAWATAEDPQRWRPMPTTRFLVPWAPETKASQNTTVVAQNLPGDWARGRKLFNDPNIGCAKCHSVNGAGGNLGPDLGNLAFRDPESVRRDIVNPSYAIHPDYLGHVVTLKNGKVLTGTLRSKGNTLLVGDSQGTTHEIPRGEVESLEPVAKSVMPDKLDEKLGKEGMVDLIHFLLSGAPSMPLEGRAVPYPARSRAEVLKVLAGAPEGEMKKGPINILLTAGPKDHGPQEHDYPAWQKVWTRLMAMAPGVEVDTAWEWPKKEQLEKAKLLVLFQRGDWNGQRAQDMDAFLQKGGGVVLLHWAVDGRMQTEAFAERIGLAAHGGGIGFRHGPLTLNLQKDAMDHPILRNMGDLKIHDESYWKLTGREDRVNVLARSKEDGKDWPQVWTKQTGKGRVVGLIPGHYSWTFDDPLFRVLLLRSMAWAADEPVDRFNDLVWPGARVGE